MDLTIEYYDQHAEEFDRETAHLDLDHLYRPFLELLPPGGRILDAGCGPGRDSLAFLQRGYEVVSFDASARMAGIASRRTGRTVSVSRLQDVAFEDEFDGVWACASLLHVPSAELPHVVARLLLALKPGGVLYASFKLGQGERVQGPRRFTDLTEAALRHLLRREAGAMIIRIWTTLDLRSGRESETWLNGLVRKSPRSSQSGIDTHRV